MQKIAYELCVYDCESEGDTSTFGGVVNYRSGVHGIDKMIWLKGLISDLGISQDQA